MLSFTRTLPRALAATALAALAALAVTATAQDIKFFRIGTGDTAGTYYAIGGLIANAISNPPGSRACADGGSCGKSQRCDARPPARRGKRS